MLRITDAMLNNRQFAVGKHGDASTPGLRLEVYKGQDGKPGRMIWSARYRDKTRGERWAQVRLGEYIPKVREDDARWPLHMNLKDARTACNKVLEDNRRGITLDRKALDRTLEQDMEDWLTHNLNKKTWKRGHFAADHRRSMLTRHIPGLLQMRTVDITRVHIIKALDHVVEVTAKNPRGRRRKATDLIPTAKDIRYYLRDIFRYARRYGEYQDRWPATASNPVDDDVMSYPLGKHWTQHRKAMKLEDVQEFYAKLVRANSGELNRWFKSRAALAVRLVLLTLSPRVNEIVSATWDQMKLDQPRPEWWVPGENLKVYKNTREDNVKKRPLTPAAVALLQAIRPPRAKPTDYIFPRYARSVDGRPRFIDYTKPMTTVAPILWIRRNGYTEETVHGMRTVLVNFAATNDKSLIMAAQSGLDHTLLPGTATKDYIDNELPDDMRRLAELIADFLEPAQSIALPPTERGRRVHPMHGADGRFAAAS